MFLSLSIFAIWTDIHTLTTEITKTTKVDTKLKQIVLLRTLIQELQKERGLTNIYLSSKNKETLALLQKQRETLQNDIEKVASHIKSSELLCNINIIHTHVKDSSYTKVQAFKAYTHLIFNMMIETKKLLLFTNDQNIRNHFLIYQNTNFVQEYLGQLRAIIGGVLGEKKITRKQYVSIIQLQTLVENYISQTQQNILLTDSHIISPLQKKCFKQTNNIIHTLLQDKLSSIKTSPIEWFNISTCAIDSISDTMTKHLEHITQEIANKKAKELSSLYYHLFFWIFAIVISIVLSILLFNTNKKMLIKQKLLKDYKKAIDNSTIVSKTDKHGFITHANKAFCDISGYTQEELLGKPHNIVRHPDVDKKVFKELWSTIKKGKTWSGQVLNLAKNKTPYWVQASISPIYDNNNNLVEYIAIRHDITQIIELNKEIKNTQYELIYRMGESVESRSKESGHHIQRVAHYSKLLAHYYGLSNQEAETIFIASTMHDMGKIAIPDSILLKAAKLSNDEWEIMKTHSAIGYKILEGSNLPILKMAAEIAYGHHEYYNGQGYPRGIAKEEISIYARIVAIADVFDALISDRVYKKAWPLEKVVLLFEEESSRQFDPELVELFLANVHEFIKIKNQFED
jgi:PAS domain S-box-containing protein